MGGEVYQAGAGVLPGLEWVLSSARCLPGVRCMVHWSY